MVQAVDYLGIRNQLTSIIQAANTTTATYNLSNSLTASIVTITNRDLSIEPLMITEFPAVSVRLVSKTEDFAEFGNGIIDRDITVSAQIACVYDSGDKASAEDNLWIMVRNVEANLRLNTDLNNYNTAGAKVTAILPSSAEFVDNFGDESSYNKSATIDIAININSIDV
jgi:hypothetical protein